MRSFDLTFMPEAATGADQPNSRRALLTRAARLSMVALPLTLSMFGPTTAAAQRPVPEGGEQPGSPPQPDSVSTPSSLPTPGSFPTRPNGGTAGKPPQDANGWLTLVPVGSANGGTGGDFGANNAGSDSLSSGSVAVNTSNRQVSVLLRGAKASSSYDLQFVRLNDHGHEDLGSISTDDNGNASGTAPNNLGGSHRVGAFVLIRDGQDQYVTTID